MIHTKLNEENVYDIMEEICDFLPEPVYDSTVYLSQREIEEYGKSFKIINFKQHEINS